MDDKKAMYVSVGGTIYATTKETLQAESGSIFDGLMKMRRIYHAPCGMPMPFVDRNGELFKHVLEYLRAVVQGNVDGYLNVTEDTDTLLAVHEEARYYNLPKLGALCRQQLFMPRRMRCWFEGPYRGDGIEHDFEGSFPPHSSLFRWRIRNIWLLSTLQEKIVSPRFQFQHQHMQFTISPNRMKDNVRFGIKACDTNAPMSRMDCEVALVVQKNGKLKTEQIMSFSNYKSFNADQVSRDENFLPVEWSMFPSHYKNIVFDGFITLFIKLDPM